MKNTNWNKNLLVIGAAGGAIAAVVLILLIFTARTYTIYMKESADGYARVTAEYSEPGVVEMVSDKMQNEFCAVTFRALKPGVVSVEVVFDHRDAAFEGQADRYYTSLRVTKLGTILEPANLDFNGFYILCGGLALFFLFAGVHLIVVYRKSKAQRFFSYETVLHLGVGAFLLLQGLLFLGLEVCCVLLPDAATGRVLFLVAQYAMTLLVAATFPFVLLLALSMVVSNLWLIRHEGLRRTNALCIALAVVLMAGVGASVLLTVLNAQWLAFEPASLLISSVRTVVSTLYLYFAANLVAAQVCCVAAAHRKPPLPQDYVLILGCAIKKDGTLYPLIRGRADRAMAFYHAQKQQTGTAPVLVPSGGQGSDEVIAEGEAVRRYLLGCGIPEEDILAETASANTLQNMRFSKALIDERTKDARVIFSTTNYHVFRSGVLAASVGLHADGIASKTKWYFWPNAQLREFVGLVVGKWKLHLLLVVLLTLFSLALSNLGLIINSLVS